MKRNREKAIAVQRAYDDPGTIQQPAFLVDRLWPRGIRKERLKIEGWLKNVGPSNGLRKWFGHDPAKWPDFKRRYFEELKKKPQAWKPLLEAAHKGPITLLFGAKDVTHNNAVALEEFLKNQKDS